MRGKACILSFVGILSLSIAFAGLYGGTAFAGGENNKNAHWTQKHIRKVPPIMMYDPFFSELFDQTDRDVPYNYEEAVKQFGHSCGATSGGWVITKKALEVLYPDETPVRGNIRVYVDGAEDEWNFGVIGEAISFITGAASSGGFKGAEFGAQDDVYVRKDKMIYAAAHTHRHPGPPLPNQPFVTFKFERIDTAEEVCLDYWLGLIVPNPKNDPGYVPSRGTLGAKVANGAATEEEAEAFAAYWNERVEFVFENADWLVIDSATCPIPLPAE